MRQMLINSHLIPCDGKEAIKNGAVLINGNKIEAVGRRDELEPLERALKPDQLRDMGGRWIMPGLMDMHVHLALSLPGPAAMAALLEGDMALTLRSYRNALDALNVGVTFIRTVGDKRFVDLALKKAINTGQHKGPRLHCAGHAVIITGGHGFAGAGTVEADGADGFRAAVRAQLREGADLIKLCITGGIAGEHEGIRDSQATFAEMEAAAEAAHNAGKKITAHAGSSDAIVQGIRAGLDCIEHGYFLDDIALDFMAKHGTYLVPTLCVSRAEEYMRERNIPQWMIDKSLAAGEEHLFGYSKAVKAGIKIAFGTDMLPAERHYGTYAVYAELEHMVEGGMSPATALMSATAHAADLCSVSDKLGSLTAGKFADLVAMPANPLENIKNIRTLDFVMKDGEIFRNFEEAH
jgi:imidazolonepropionase-like amidohydrolase